jgi:hypothetical protein
MQNSGGARPKIMGHSSPSLGMYYLQYLHNAKLAQLSSIFSTAFKPFFLDPAPSRRRKKNPSGAIRTFEIVRGRFGFGFTLSGTRKTLLLLLDNLLQSQLVC